MGSKVKKAKKKRIFSLKSEIFFMNDLWSCDKKFPSTSYLKYHALIHTRVKPIVCNISKKIYISK